MIRPFDAVQVAAEGLTGDEDPAWNSQALPFHALLPGRAAATTQPVPDAPILASFPPGPAAAPSIHAPLILRTILVTAAFVFRQATSPAGTVVAGAAAAAPLAGGALTTRRPLARSATLSRSTTRPAPGGCLPRTGGSVQQSGNQGAEASKGVAAAMTTSEQAAEMIESGRVHAHSPWCGQRRRGPDTPDRRNVLGSHTIKMASRNQPRRRVRPEWWTWAGAVSGENCVS